MKKDEDTFASLVNKKVLKEFKKEEQILLGTDDYYSHPTFCINNLSDYIQLISVISSINKDDEYSETVIYRGVADSEYKLIPGLSRLKSLQVDTENELITDFLTRRPDEFSGLSDFDMLAKMQHYGLPTRLLDFSLNPLIALYFACESKWSKSGRIICHNTFLENDSSPFIKSLCKAVVRKPLDDNYTIEEYLCNDNLTLHKYLIEAYLCNKNFVVRPKYWNQRISNQAGVFMVFPNNIIDRYRGILIHSNELGLLDAIKHYRCGKVDENILKTIFATEPIHNSIYITDEDLKSKIDAYKTDFSTPWENIEKYFENRFTVTNSLKELSQSTISNQFCSIIVESKYKRKILKELSYIGIGADYIYPELEYTAKEIKRKYE